MEFNFVQKGYQIVIAEKHISDEYWWVAPLVLVSLMLLGALIELFIRWLRSP